MERSNSSIKQYFKQINGYFFVVKNCFFRNPERLGCSILYM